MKKNKGKEIDFSVNILFIRSSLCTTKKNYSNDFQNHKIKFERKRKIIETKIPDKLESSISCGAIHYQKITLTGKITDLQKIINRFIRIN